MAKSKRSKHMRAMRRILREKLSKKDEAKRLAAMKNDNLIPPTAKTTVKDSSTLEDMQTSGNTNTTGEYNSRTLKNKDGQYPVWLSGRQRKRLQAKNATQKRIEKKKKTKTATGKGGKRKVQPKKSTSDQSEAMLT